MTRVLGPHARTPGRSVRLHGPQPGRANRTLSKSRCKMFPGSALLSPMECKPDLPEFEQEYNKKFPCGFSLHASRRFACATGKIAQLADRHPPVCLQSEVASVAREEVAPPGTGQRPTNRLSRETLSTRTWASWNWLQCILLCGLSFETRGGMTTSKNHRLLQGYGKRLFPPVVAGHEKGISGESVIFTWCPENKHVFEKTANCKTRYNYNLFIMRYLQISF